jgi:hypothetical protein
MSDSISREELIKVIKEQHGSVRLWWSEWERHKDFQAAIHAAYALGKVMGAYNTLLRLNGGHTDVSEEVHAIVADIHKKWDSL